MIVLPHPEWKVAAGSLDTGVPLSIAGQLLGQPRDPHARRPLPRDGGAGRALLRNARAPRRCACTGVDPTSAHPDERNSVPIASINPATGQTLRDASTPHSADRDRATPRARRRALSRAGARSPSPSARPAWRGPPSILEARKQELGRIMTLEMGKPIGAAIAEAEKCAWACRYYAEHAERFLADEPVATDATRELRPLPAARRGARRHALELPVLAGLPLRRAGADGGQRRPAEARLERAAVRARDRGDLPRAGFPAGAFQTLLIGAERVAALIDDPRIAAVTLTGSEGAGRQRRPRRRRADQEDRARARRQRSLHRDAERRRRTPPPRPRSRRARSTTASPASPPSASSCTRAVADEFERTLRRGMAALKVGDPMDPTAEIGPLATPAIRRRGRRRSSRRASPPARGCCSAASASTARATSTRRPCSPTCRPTAPPRSRRSSARSRASSASRASTRPSPLANDTRFGLGASAWTSDAAERERLVAASRPARSSSTAWSRPTRACPSAASRSPATAASSPMQGIREFVNVKTVWVA